MGCGGSKAQTPSGVQYNLEEKIAKINAIKVSNPDNIACACFDQTYFDSLKENQKHQFIRCLNSGIENADS
jgi:hypothetical protein